MTNILKSLKNLVYDLTWKKEYIEEEISELELKQLERLSIILQNKYEHSSKQKSSVLDQFKNSNLEYLKKIDGERKKSIQVTRTKNRQPILYARFPEDYKLNPTDAREYLNNTKV